MRIQRCKTCDRGLVLAAGLEGSGHRSVASPVPCSRDCSVQPVPRLGAADGREGMPTFAAGDECFKQVGSEGRAVIGLDLDSGLWQTQACGAAHGAPHATDARQ